MAPLTSTGEQRIRCSAHICISPMYTAASGSWTVLNGPYNVYIYVQVGLPAGCRWVGGMVGVSGVGGLKPLYIYIYMYGLIYRIVYGWVG